MRGKLAKAIRKATRFHPADERRYRLINPVRVGWYAFVGQAVSEGSRRDYQELKQRVLARKRGGRAHA